jgi:hypothetical protein
MTNPSMLELGSQGTLQKTQEFKWLPFTLHVTG